MAIKTAIIGYGRNGSTMHAGPIEKLDQFQMVAVCDIDKKAQDEAAKRFGCNIYDDYHLMLDSEDIDLVVIVTRSSQHAKMACDCLRAGKNVLVTKPWAVNADEAREMIKASKESGSKLLPWLPARWGGRLKILKDIVESGDIGNVFLIKRSVSTFGIRSDWQTLKVNGGGYLLNWGPHIIDTAMQLIGAEALSVYARTAQVINPGDVEDMFYAVIKTTKDVTIVTEHAIACTSISDWVIQGDRGTITVDGCDIVVNKASIPKDIDVSAYRSKVIIETSTINCEDIAHTIYGDENVVYQDIALEINNEKTYPVTCKSALKLSEIFDAVKDSARDNVIINL